MSLEYLELILYSCLLVSLIALWLLVLFRFVLVLDSINRKSMKRTRAHDRRDKGMVWLITPQLFRLKIKRFLLGTVVFGPLIAALLSFYS
ncbi:MAG: hypothetical protein JSW41_02170 [Candidatus Aenigmatarchaeota archaeon]|nr:MAG: hypothetical protein JSW41_02170 [Candidatus Aenigmarchaeota archaeon]